MSFKGGATMCKISVLVTGTAGEATAGCRTMVVLHAGLL